MMDYYRKYCLDIYIPYFRIIQCNTRFTNLGHKNHQNIDVLKFANIFSLRKKLISRRRLNFICKFDLTFSVSLQKRLLLKLFLMVSLFTEVKSFFILQVRPEMIFPEST